jgi:hypothetical protein
MRRRIHVSLNVLLDSMNALAEMRHMYPPPHMTYMYPPPHMNALAEMRYVCDASQTHMYVI